jgi:enamine deaminase RidA (YjgF/YER057c/UK114 family)
MRSLLVPAALAFVFAAGSASAENVHINPANGIISAAVKVQAGSETLYVSGVTPDAVSGAPAEAPFGDTKTQVASILKKIAATLAGQGYGWEDVVMMRVLLVGDPAKSGAMDFAGMMESYNAVYGSLKKKPARITSQVAGLVRPGMLAEIEVQAAKK